MENGGIYSINQEWQSLLLTLIYPMGYQLHVQHKSVSFCFDIWTYIFYSFNILNHLGPSMELNLRNIKIYGTSYLQYSHFPTPFPNPILFFHSLFQSWKAFWMSGWWVGLRFFVFLFNISPGHSLVTSQFIAQDICYS